MPDNPLFGTEDPELLQIGDGSGADTIYGGDGRDTIFGHEGHDELVGDGGNDRIWGGAGNDRVDGLDGDDRLFGGSGNDYFDAGWGNDTVYGGSGDDGLSAGYGLDLLYGGDGNDEVLLYGSIPQGGDTAYGGAGNDIASFLDASDGHFDGGTGTDTLSLYWYQTGGETLRALVDMRGPAPVAHSLSDTGEIVRQATFTNVEALQILTGFGDDTVYGADGDDQIAVSLGNNLVDAGGGGDHVTYTAIGSNTLEGGSGNDTLVVGTINYRIVTFDGSGPVATDGFGSALTGFERFEVYDGSYSDSATLGGGDDTFHGSWGNDSAHGGGGNDRLDGGRDDDDLQGEAGDDVLIGGRGRDVLDGGADADRLFGGADADVLYGGDGRDVLVGGAGADVLWGGDGLDSFRLRSAYEGAAAADRIGDFATGTDRLTFAQSMLDNAPEAGRLADIDLSFGTVNGAGGQFLYLVAGSEGRLFWDSDGSGTAETMLLVVLDGAPTLAGSDVFIL